MIEMQTADVRNCNTRTETGPTPAYTLGEIKFACSTVKASKVGLFNRSFSDLNFEGLTVVII